MCECVCVCVSVCVHVRVRVRARACVWFGNYGISLAIVGFH